MFRKDAGAISEWSPENVTLCKERQEMILAYADAMLKPGGVLVYSTCTFAPQEDEEQVSDFLDKHDEYFYRTVGKIFFRQTVALKMAPLQVPCSFISPSDLW